MNGTSAISVVPVIPKCRSIVFETGNILTWSRLKKKPLLPGSEDVVESIGLLSRCWLNQKERRPLQYAKTLSINCPKHREMLQQQQAMEDREDLRIFVKLTIWLNTYRHGAVRDAVLQALNSLATSDCDGIVLSVASPHPLLLEDVKPLWEELEQLQMEDIVGSLGVADFMPELLEELCQWAREKPRMCQIYDKVACSTPPRLRTLAAAYGLQLLTHSDPPEPLPAVRLSGVIGEVFGPADSAGWQPNWLARITSSYRHRGVVSSWGFVAMVDRRI